MIYIYINLSAHKNLLIKLCFIKNIALFCSSKFTYYYRNQKQFYRFLKRW
jgi:hypothetical protein